MLTASPTAPPLPVRDPPPHPHDPPPAPDLPEPLPDRDRDPAPPPFDPQGESHRPPIKASHQPSQF
jgi:hypothetical protein